jgi:hypothetical protein
VIPGAFFLRAIPVDGPIINVLPLTLNQLCAHYVEGQSLAAPGRRRRFWRLTAQHVTLALRFQR